MFAITKQAKDDLSGSCVSYLLKTQTEGGYWEPQSNRPPLEGSRVSCAVLSLTFMQQFAKPAQQADVKRSVARARNWLADAPLESHEDRMFWLWGADRLDLPKTRRESTLGEVLASQQADGSWSQLPEMSGDAYATGQALYILRKIGVPHSSQAARIGAEFLLQTQQDDGSWFVQSRSRPVQTFFDNGDPHGKHQFISIAATAWATAALAGILRDLDTRR
jgi:N-acyl-D-amino-acid deacylase